MVRHEAKPERKRPKRADAALPAAKRRTATPVAAVDEAPSAAADSPGKRRLIEAAALEFAERGFDGASVLSIALRAGVKQPLVNYHFGTKEGLWRAVVEVGYQPIQVATADEPHAVAEPLQRLKELLVAFAGANVRHRWIHPIVQKETSSSGPRLDWLVDTYLLPFNRQLSAQIEACVARGIFKPVPTQQVIVMMTGALVAIFTASALPQRMYGNKLKRGNVADGYVENAIDVLFQGLMRSRVG